MPGLGKEQFTEDECPPKIPHFLTLCCCASSPILLIRMSPQALSSISVLLMTESVAFAIFLQMMNKDLTFPSCPFLTTFLIGAQDDVVPASYITNSLLALPTSLNFTSTTMDSSHFDFVPSRPGGRQVLDLLLDLRKSYCAVWKKQSSVFVI